MNHLHEKAFIGLQDMNGTDIHEGDIVVYHLQGNHTMKEYWNPVYKVVFIPPSFTLEHIGGGKCSGSLEFKLKSGGKNTVLEILKNWEKTVDDPSTLEEIVDYLIPSLEQIISGKMPPNTFAPDVLALKKALRKRAEQPIPAD